LIYYRLPGIVINSEFKQYARRVDIIFLLSLFHAVKQKNKKTICVIKQRSYNKKCTLYQKLLLSVIAIFYLKKYCNTTCNTKHVTCCNTQKYCNIHCNNCNTAILITVEEGSTNIATSAIAFYARELASYSAYWLR